MSTDTDYNSNDRRQESLPTNVDAERFVLGSVLKDAESHLPTAVRAELSPDNFSLRKHQVIFRRILELDQRGET